MRVHLTMKSGNVKTGPMPVSTTEKASCPDSCSLKAGGCYAQSGPLGIHWAAVSNGKRGTEWAEFVDVIAALPDDILWRHNQAGDLPSRDNINIDQSMLDSLIKANYGKRGFTYTHYDVINNPDNAFAVKSANTWGFTINLSAESLQEADKLVDMNIGPVVTLLPEVSTKVTYTPQGRKVITCPAFHNDTVSCNTCKLCQRQDRPIIGFPVHGTSKKKAGKVFAIKSI